MNHKYILSLLAIFLIIKHKKGCIDCGITCEEAPGLPFYSANKISGKKKRYL